ncbi:ATP-binding cassette domain-containing protein [Diaphorobacter aerolatus]|uniref:ATP-binding cassette domain-containing protein n=1 Tax=Diaphorobacter aerolatus TaxID=1288495 RepID=A0A7H0GLZ7_9BURK|nr:hypothetical protein [Diaphorobacter aerolatus]QNP49313.1 hypothetical protein H9K75_04410 [Diaphorobacter aerolatus]
MLIDEPTSGMPEATAQEIIDLIRTLSGTVPVLVVTHNQRHARAMAKEVILLASGMVQEQTPAARFFEAPQSESGRQFLLTGSCPEVPLWPTRMWWRTSISRLHRKRQNRAPYRWRKICRRRWRHPLTQHSFLER